jgi:hypothetical protein
LTRNLRSGKTTLVMSQSSSRVLALRTLAEIRQLMSKTKLLQERLFKLEVSDPRAQRIAVYNDLQHAEAHLGEASYTLYHLIKNEKPQ